MVTSLNWGNGPARPRAGERRRRFPPTARGRAVSKAEGLSKKALGREQRLRLANARDAMPPAFVAAQDLDLDAEEINRYIRLGQARETDGVLLGGHDHLQIATDAAIDE